MHRLDHALCSCDRPTALVLLPGEGDQIHVRGLTPHLSKLAVVGGGVLQVTSPGAGGDSVSPWPLCTAFVVVSALPRCLRAAGLCFSRCYVARAHGCIPCLRSTGQSGQAGHLLPPPKAH